MADDPDPGHKLVRRSSLGKGSKKRRMSKKKYDGRSIMDDMVGVSDMVLLDPLTEDKLMENLEKRFKAGEIYVSWTMKCSWTVVFRKYNHVSFCTNPRTLDAPRQEIIKFDQQ